MHAWGYVHELACHGQRSGNRAADWLQSTTTRFPSPSRGWLDRLDRLPVLPSVVGTCGCLLLYYQLCAPCRTLFSELAKVGDLDSQGMCAAMVEEIEPSIRCAGQGRAGVEPRCQGWYMLLERGWTP